ncbi:MAG: hypothetical protein PHW77_04385 [Eubacteriales bacterium]|nr:hypothetical protein [Eubacteriales bacterium]
MNVAEKAAYIKGLMEGMKFNTETDEGKLIKNIVDLLEDLSLSVQDLEDETATLGDYIDEIDQDLGEVEEEVFGYPVDRDYDECDCECEDCDCDDDCDCDCDER